MTFKKFVNFFSVFVQNVLLNNNNTAVYKLDDDYEALAFELDAVENLSNWSNTKSSTLLHS